MRSHNVITVVVGCCCYYYFIDNNHCEMGDVDLMSSRHLARGLACWMDQVLEAQRGHIVREFNTTHSM